MQEDGTVASKQAGRATGRSGSSPGSGAFMHLTITVDGGVIREASYETYQCPGCVACGKGICGLALGKTLEEAQCLRHGDIVRVVGPLAKHRQVCYGLALLALNDAIKQVGGVTGP